MRKANRNFDLLSHVYLRDSIRMRIDRFIEKTRDIIYSICLDIRKLDHWLNCCNEYNGICGSNIIWEYDTSLRLVKDINLSSSMKTRRIDRIYLDPIREVIKYLHSDIHKIPIFSSFFYYPYISREDHVCNAVHGSFNKLAIYRIKEY